MNPDLLDFENFHGAMGHFLAQYIRECVVYNKNINLYHCTAITLTANGIYYLKQHLKNYTMQTETVRGPKLGCSQVG